MLERYDAERSRAKITRRMRRLVLLARGHRHVFDLVFGAEDQIDDEIQDGGHGTG